MSGDTRHDARFEFRVVQVLEAGVIEVLASITSQHQLNNHFKAHMSLKWTTSCTRIKDGVDLPFKPPAF